jgi:WD40 repeat protein
MSWRSLYFLKKNFKNIEKDTVSFTNQHEKVKFTQIRSIEEHNSGVNQVLKLNQKEIITASDDCTMKFWNSDNLLIEHQIMTETITCIASTGSKKEIIVAGCHSGNLIFINS